MSSSDPTFALDHINGLLRNPNKTLDMGVGDAVFIEIRGR